MKKFSDQELESLLDDGESDLVERKESFKGETPKRARQAVCAFSNDLPNHNKPGILFIGAKDDGMPSNAPITDALLCALADMKTDGNILSSPTFSVEKRVLKGSEMAIVTVMPSDMPPVRYEGRIWIRTGPRRAIANAQEERILSEKRRHKNLPFDVYPFPPAKLSDLSRLIFENEYLPAAFAPDVLEANGRTYEERLAACKMIVSREDTTPTILGLLAIGKSPQDFLAGTYIQFLRIDGTELADPVIDEEKMGGALVDMLHRIEEKLAAHNRTAFDVTSMPTHIQTSSYPVAALHQIIYNALLHRTYEGVNAPVHVYWFNDRIEISSPGGPYGNVTEKNFGEPGIVGYRNPNIGDVLKIFGFVQAFGRGIAIARQALKKNGNPPPEFKVDQSRVLCIIRKKA
jgi:ATP-dependent DNA helicase RecG